MSIYTIVRESSGKVLVTGNSEEFYLPSDSIVRKTLEGVVLRNSQYQKIQNFEVDEIISVTNTTGVVTPSSPSDLFTALKTVFRSGGGTSTTTLESGGYNGTGQDLKDEIDAIVVNVNVLGELTADFEFENYALATADTSIYQTGDVVFIEQTTGIWILGTQKSSGDYYWNGTSLEYVTKSLKDRIKLLETNVQALGESWGDIATNIKYNGTETTIAGGEVLEGLYQTNTVYRYITTANDANGYPSEDSFYSNFDGTNLTNLIITRG